jgi:hypothetical protein
MMGKVRNTKTRRIAINVGAGLRPGDECRGGRSGALALAVGTVWLQFD